MEVWFSPTNKRFYTVLEPVPGRRREHFRRGAAQQRRRGAGAQRLRHAGATAPWPERLKRPEAAVDPDAALVAEMATLKREMKILERAIRVVGMQRDEWKKEADTLRDNWNRRALK
ncbi:MAG: hypothetical protein WDN04_20765 [Rhodospirillales bacterium]